ncbi:TRAP transporter substrate-binding protein DctP [Alkalihalobacterium alkalinitrilicum]|uniref:TRAP transporter substrate-binding protein DctP n=1 Tax=Alkalihalobacterium alkalinitrilicum TaxID=427920 RepID=UPI0009950B47|nr:TRAP transporter substrate-binding protein DctP [Alkalihalobacterium alkalinitrilicum]
MKKRSMLILFVMFILIVAACSNSNQSTGTSDEKLTDTKETITLKLGHPSPPQHSYGLTATGFANEIEEASNGRLIIEVYDSGQLGGQRELIEGVQVGTLDLAIVSSGPVTNFVDELSVLDLPFLFEDIDHVHRTLDGGLGEVFSEKMEEVGLKSLGFLDFGFKNFVTTGKPVYSAEDIRGMKIRAQESPIIVDTYNSLGADPTTMDAAEVFTSLQQGVINAGQDTFGVAQSFKLYEVQDYITKVPMSYGGAVLMISPITFNSLDAELQALLIEIGEKNALLQRQLNKELEEAAEKYVQENGMEVIGLEEVDIKSFINATKIVYDKYGETYRDLIDIVDSHR